MSTSYYVFCQTCNQSITDEDSCDNAPQIPLCIVKNIIPYAHLAMLIDELPIPDTSWLEVDIKLSGSRLDISALRKHVTHSLIVKNEYGERYPKDETSTEVT